MDTRGGVESRWGGGKNLSGSKLRGENFECKDFEGGTYFRDFLGWCENLVANFRGVRKLDWQF